MNEKKVLFAVGGTGGHLYPAQALARDLKESDSSVEILFAGGKLGSNPYFHKLQFPFRDITSATPFRGGLFRSFFRIARGLIQSLKLVREFSPDLVVGFGSFYSFPLLLAARIQRTPYLLVESNALPGKVNRLFSAKARLSALQFEIASKRLKGPASVAKIPHWSQQFADGYLTPEEARKSFGLDPNCLTLLIFGGSQGARAINEAIQSVALPSPIQVIHLCGADQDDRALSEKWKARGIASCVKPFENNMHLAWRAADLTICRAGAGTCAEVLESKTPALMIPWPGASEGHQRENARYLVEKGLAHSLEQEDLADLESALSRLFAERGALVERLEEVNREEIEDLSTLVMRQLI